MANPISAEGNHEEQRARIELDAILSEAEKLWPFLSKEEKKEKQKEYGVRVGKALQRCIEALECELSDENADAQHHP